MSFVRDGGLLRDYFTVPGDDLGKLIVADDDFEVRDVEMRSEVLSNCVGTVALHADTSKGGRVPIVLLQGVVALFRLLKGLEVSIAEGVETRAFLAKIDRS